MHNYTRLNESIKQISKGVYNSIKPTSIKFGTVTSEKPFKIRLEQKLELGINQLILSRNVTNYKATMRRSGGTTDTYEVFNKLKVGERVILLRLEGGQKFLVLDRVGDP